VELVAEYADIMQVGSRNMEHFSLLERLGGCGRTVLLKRGMVATLQDLLRSAECLASAGNGNVLLCERGIRTFDTVTRNTFDIAAVPLLKSITHLPVIVDPSHAAGIRELVPILARAGAVAGADGLLVEVHPDPEKALSDGEQSLTFAQFEEMMRDLDRYVPVAAKRAQLDVVMGGRRA
jgi:3-deoxy-7-phosphoheptulonate synthase